MRQGDALTKSGGTITDPGAAFECTNGCKWALFAQFAFITFIAQLAQFALFSLVAFLWKITCDEVDLEFGCHRYCFVTSIFCSSIFNDPKFVHHK